MTGVLLRRSFHSQGKRALAEHPARDQFLAGVASSKWQRPRVKPMRLFNQPKPKPEPKPKADETDETDD